MTSLQADEAFVEHYQLTHDPFTPRVPGFKFFPAQRKPVLAQLHQLARYSALMQVVSGPLGSGKTLLRQALVASSNKQSVVSVPLSARQAGNSAALLRGFSQGLGGSSQDVDGLLGQVARLNQAGQEVYLLVDDAEKLQDEALETLAALAAGDSDGRAHVFLFAEPELLERLEALGKAERCHVQELQPYTLEETRAYLAQRLEGAGQGLELFEDRQLEEIQVESGGWPGAINRVAREVLNEAMLAEDQPAVSTGAGMNLPKKHLLALGVVAAGVALALLMNGREPEVAPAVTDNLALGQPGAAAQNEVAVASTASASAGPAIQFEGDKPLPLPLVGQGQPVPREPLARAAGGAGVEELDASHAAMPVPVGVADSANAPAGGVAAGVAPVMPAEPPSATPVAQPKPAPTPVPVAEVNPAPAAPLAVAPTAKPVPAPAPTPSAPTGSTGSSSWYLSQPVGQYTLQLFGTSSEGAAQAAVREGGGDYRYFRKLHQSKPLYVVTYGSFSTPAAAKSAVAGLPARLQASKPWPRTFASIQQEIRQAGR
ncbi:DamX protein [Pseudomonas linyingensis]|uniref:DamX protein n=1 Tax=Pseudomonas linyingensis TaxID=915471 RepID=A0A1H6TV97_9PSED|nr:AAA family ATPase [Pseudomonas linyingensis]SEI81167.1 DamX protein [Pseudomonas linyingensis]